MQFNESNAGIVNMPIFTSTSNIRLRGIVVVDHSGRGRMWVGRPSTGVVDSNPTLCMDVCQRFSVSCLQEPVTGSCEHGNEPSGSVNAGNFLTS
jgi:hypothetical protein